MNDSNGFVNCDYIFDRQKSRSPDGNWTIDLSPYISGGKAFFFYRGDAEDVELASDFSAWKPDGQTFQTISDTAIKCFEMDFAQSARVEYKIVADENWILDSLNPNKIDNGVGGENSFLTMPDYQPTAWDGGENVPLESLEIDSKIWRETRKIQIYAPAANAALPVMYLQDGSDYVNRARAVQIQQNLIKAGKIKPFIMVFIDYKDRLKEYWASDDYAKYLAAEIVPVIDAKYKTIQNRDGRTIFGASLGGVTSVWTALKYPEVFGRVGGQSSAFWIDDERVIKEMENLDASKTPFRFYFDTGTLEGAADDRKAVAVLSEKGYNVAYEEAAAGHNWTAWRDRLADAFIALQN